MSTTDTTVIVVHNPRRRKQSKSPPPRMSDLRIVLLGSSMSENSHVGNFILGRSAFDSEAPPDVVERVGGRLKDRHVIIINSPQLLQTNISDHQITQTVRECVHLSDPGPHVIVLLLKHESCSAEDQECVEKVLHSFSERVYQHTMVLSTRETNETNHILQKIIQKCANRHFSLQRSSSPDDLLQTLEDIEKMNEGRHLDCASQYFTMEKQDTGRRQGLNVAHNIKNNWSKEIEGGSNENLPMFKLSLDETWQNRDGFCRRSMFGKNITKENKTIMMIGARGAGKTTLINSMINYILGVKWEDDFRFVLIDEEKQRYQAESQTSEITAYQINHMDGFQVPYSLTIVDTPGFGDTRGISHDQKITKQIQEFFSGPGGIDCIDAVCFVVQASLARLTHTQKYMFDSILSIFGKDIAPNILVLVTFSDGKVPPVLEAIKASEVPCSTNESGEPLHFKFNNSAMFATNNKSADDEESDCENFDQMFWKFGFSSMKKFFTSLNRMETQSLSLTQEVLKERQQLEVHVQDLQPQINAGLKKLNEIKKTRSALEQHKAEMDANKDFEYVIEVTVPKQIENTTGYYLNNCQKCYFTCHDTCPYPKDSDKYKCRVMKDGKCTVCPGKCAWNVHFNQRYKWEYVREKRKETYQDLKKRYEAAHEQVMSKEKIFEELENEFEAVQDIVTELIEGSQKPSDRLQEIALKPNPLSIPDYIDLMIESEKQEVKPGFQDRIQSLMEVRNKAEIISKVSRGAVLPDDWQNYRRLETEYDLGIIASPWSPEFIQDLLPSAERTALLYHLSYLCLGGFPKLERMIRERAVETQMLFGSSEAVLMKCVGMSSKLVKSLFPKLKKAVEINNSKLALIYLEKAKQWITDITHGVTDMVKRYEEQSNSVSASTSDVFQEQAETKVKLTNHSDEMKGLEDVLANLAVELEKNADDMKKTAELSRPEAEKNRLRDKEWEIKIEQTDHQLKLATFKIKMGEIPSPDHLTEVQKCLCHIMQILVNLKKFWEKVGVTLDTMKEKTFAGEEIIHMEELKEVFLASIEEAGKYWQKFGACCQKAQGVFSIQSKDAYKFLAINPSSLSEEERKEQYKAIMEKLEKISPHGSSSRHH